MSEQTSKQRESSLSQLDRAGLGKAPEILRMPEPALRLLVPMRDGVQLDTYVWLPAGVVSAPAILLRTPYREDVIGWARIGHMRFVEAGYALVYQMIRGQGRSQGTFSFSAPHEKTDGYDTVEWIAAQPWCNGKVGMDGGSYLGMTALAAAAARPPHLTCISTSVPSADFFREIPYFGGGFSRQHTLNWLNLIQIDSLAELSGGFLGVMPILAQPDWVRRVTMRPLCDAGDDLLRDDKLAHYRDCLAHPTFDDWWREKTLGPDDYRAMDLPVLVISGNFDLGIGAMTAWHGIVAHAADRADQQLLIGPWDHGQVYNGAGTVYGPFELGDAAPGDPNLLRFAFFDRHLKGQGHGPDVGGKAKIFITGRNDYRSFDVWPPREVRTTELFLASFGRANTYRGDGELLAAPRANAPSDTMRADPALPFVPAMTSALNLQLDLREQVRHAETLVYATTPLEAPLTIFGEPVVTLHVQADTKDADIGVYLCEMRANGSVAQLARHLLRLRYREGFDREVLLMPGEPVEARIKLTFVAHEVAPGAQLALLVTPDMFPWVDPNPNTGEPIATALESRIANVTVLHDAANPSRVTLPVLP